MEQSSRLDAQIGLQEKSSILQAWTDFKDSIFNVLFVILDKKSEDEEEESLVRLALESGLDYLQIMAFPFHAGVIQAWNGGESLGGLAKFFKQFSIGSYLPGAPFSAFLVVVYGLIFIILLIIVDIVYVSYSFSKKKFRFTFPLVVLAQVVPLFVTVLFLPITEVLMNMVECEREAELGWVMSSFKTVQCWTGWHLLHSSITLLFVAIFVIISCVVALALFQPRMTVGRLTARQNSNGEVVFILNKIILLFLFIFNPVDGTAFNVTAMFLLSFWQFWCYSVKQPYYSKAATKFFKVCSTYYLWTTLMLFVGQVLGPYGFDGALVIWMSGLPFFAVIVYFQTPSDIDTLFVSNLKFKSGEQLQAHVAYVLQLVGSQATDKNSYMLLIGYIEKHKEVCNQGDCPLKTERKRRRGEDNMDQGCQQVLKQVERMFKAGVKKFPQCTKLRISFAFFQLEHLKNKEKAYEEFSAASKLDPSFQQQFNIYRFKKIIRENLQNNRQGSDADLIQTIRFENYVSLLEEAMLLSAKLHKQFWTQLKEEIPDLNKLNIVGAQITQAGSNIAQNYSEISKINSAACQVLYSYAHYLILVSEDYQEGREMLANARKIFQDRQSGHSAGEQLHFEQHSLNKMTAPVLILAPPTAPTALPRIKNANLMFTEVTGYQREELLGREVSRIAPKLYETEGISPFQLVMSEERDRQGFLNHKFTHLIPVQYSVTLRDGEWHVVFKLASSSSMRLLLLTDPQGVISDSNLLAQNAFRDVQAQVASQGRLFSLAEIGLQNFNSPQFKRQNGCTAGMRLGGRMGECIVQVQGVTAHVYAASAQTQDQQEQMVVVSERNIGFKVTLSRNERVQLSQSELSSQSQKKENQIDDGVLQLYDNPNVIDIFISNLAETRQLEEGLPQFQLKDKIKTMRLLNNQIKMVYTEGGEGDCSDAAGGVGTDDGMELFKFDEGYQAKLRAAINTNLNHIEVARLRRISFLFLLLLFFLNGLQLYFQANIVQAVSEFLSQGLARAEEYSLLTSNIMATIDPSANYPYLLQANSHHQVSFHSDVGVALQLENNLTVTRNLKDAVVLLNSRLLSYFQQSSSPAAIASIFANYINAIYPAFLNYPGQVSIDLSTQIILASCVGVLAILMMGYWIYISLLIDKKRYDIMIWFLDIPVPYVAHLGNHCDKYLKEFAAVKELTQRGISLQEDEDSYEEYSNKKGASDQEQIEEQIKARKSLISKNKKETLISKANLGSLKVLWLLLYASCFTVLMLVLCNNFSYDYTFLLPQWQQTSQAITIDSTLYLVLQMNGNNIAAGSTDLDALAAKLQLQHKGVIADNNLQAFNYNILTFHLTDVAAIYNTVYFSNLCTVLSLSPNNLTQCQSLVGSKLKSGYQVYSKYLIAPEPSMHGQVWLANQLYVVPALVTMLQVWSGSLSREGDSIVSLCTILLYVFVILSVLAFLLLWLYYLRKLNTELNQTIQMLNMIPFKLLPKSRKETKLFIAWIIREANKTRHQNQ